MKPTVWIIKEQVSRGSVGANVMDYTPAMKYGDIAFITHTDMPLYPQSNVALTWERDVKIFVDMYDPCQDYIITTGQPSSIFAVGYALGLANKRPRFLVWRREDNRYVEFQPEYPQ